MVCARNWPPLQLLTTNFAAITHTLLTPCRVSLIVLEIMRPLGIHSEEVTNKRPPQPEPGLLSRGNKSRSNPTLPLEGCQNLSLFPSRPPHNVLLFPQHTKRAPLFVLDVISATSTLIILFASRLVASAPLPALRTWSAKRSGQISLARRREAN